LEPTTSQEKLSLIPFLQNKRFCSELLYRNRRHQIWRVEHNSIPLIAKIHTPISSYKFSRKFSLYLRNFLRNYGERTSRGAKLLKSIGVASIDPVASGKISVGPLMREGYVIYPEIKALGTARDLLEDKLEASPAVKHWAIKEMAKISRVIHDADILHGDLVPNNFLLVKGIDGHHLVVIDTDHTRTIKWLPKIFSRFVKLSCFRRINRNSQSTAEFFRVYFNREPSRMEISALDFWSWRDRRPFSKLLKRPGLWVALALLLIIYLATLA